MTPLFTEDEAVQRFRHVLRDLYRVPGSAVAPSLDEAIAYAGAAKSERQVLDAVLKYAADHELAEAE